MEVNREYGNLACLDKHKVQLLLDTVDHWLRAQSMGSHETLGPCHARTILIALDDASSKSGQWDGQRSGFFSRGPDGEEFEVDPALCRLRVVVRPSDPLAEHLISRLYNPRYLDVHKHRPEPRHRPGNATFSNETPLLHLAVEQVTEEKARHMDIAGRELLPYMHEILSHPSVQQAAQFAREHSMKDGLGLSDPSINWKPPHCMQHIHNAAYAVLSLIHI